MAKTYNDLAFDATKVSTLLQDNIFKAGTKYYSVTNSNATPYDNELLAMNNLLNTVDLSKYYKFVVVFYNPTIDNNIKRYSDFIMIMARKTVAVNNNILNYLIAPKNASGEIIDNVPDNSTLSSLDKNLDNVKGLGLKLLVSIEKTVDDTKTYDIKDNFIYDEFTNNGKPITCNVLFNQLKELSTKAVNEGINLTLIDITGLSIKTTLNSSITIDDSLDIYREFIGGTDLTMEKLQEDLKIDNEENTVNTETPSKDSDYIN